MPVCQVFSTCLQGKNNTGTSVHTRRVGLWSLGGFWHTWKFDTKSHLCYCCPEPFSCLLSADNVCSWADVIGSHVRIPPITRERKINILFDVLYCNNWYSVLTLFVLTKYTGQCNFDAGFCLWKQSKKSDFNWQIGTKRVGSHGTGPDVDASGNGMSFSWTDPILLCSTLQSNKSLESMKSCHFSSNTTECKSLMVVSGFQICGFWSVLGVRTFLVLDGDSYFLGSIELCIRHYSVQCILSYHRVYMLESPQLTFWPLALNDGVVPAALLFLYP